MGLLEKMGLARKKARPVGQSLEKGRDDATKEKRKNLLVKVGIFLGLLVLTLAAFPRGELYQYTVQVGDDWRQETLTAPFDFPIYKSAETLEQDRREVRYRIPPFFQKVRDAQDRMAASRDTVAQQFERIFEAYERFQYNKLRGRSVEATQDSLRYYELRRNARVKITPAQWEELADSYASRMPGLASTTREDVSGPPLHEELLQDAWEISSQLLTVGVLDVPRDSILTDQVVVRDEDEHLEQVVGISKDNLYGLDEAYDYAQRQFRQEYAERPRLISLGNAIFRAIFTPSLSYMRGETLREWQQRESRISPTQGKVQEGEVIVRMGQRVTDSIKQQLQSLERVQTERSGQAILWQVMLGQLLVTLATFLVFFLYLYLLRRQIFDDNGKVLLLALLFAGIIGLYAIALRLPSVAMFAVPVALVPVLLTVMFDSRVGIFGGLTLALLGGLLLNYDFEFTFATLFAATLGVFSVRDVKNRGQLFLSAGLVFVGYLLVVGATALLYDTSRDRLVSDLVLVGANSLLLTLAYPLLWVFEKAFDITTDLTLLELSDTNRPLLKELSLRAPGTFNHSLQVANLAEAAADAVGANALLTRVGALYHDIGKMLKPEYFVENQRPGDNPHDQLKPRMSALIIASHVKEGLEMGRQYNLPKRVLDFIPMHHGTTRIEYFYRKALELHKDEEPMILESEFRYPGPRPHAKETAILMLSDSVEAASRSLAEPTHKRLETLIDMIFKARTEDGQLDDTDLTFRDLTLIKETFLSILLGIYHVRVKYPGQEEGKPEAATAKKAPKVEDTPVPAEKPPRALKGKEGVWGSLDQSVSVEQVNGGAIAEGEPGAVDQAGEAPDLPAATSGKETSHEEDVADVERSLDEQNRARGGPAAKAPPSEERPSSGAATNEEAAPPPGDVPGDGAAAPEKPGLSSRD